MSKLSLLNLKKGLFAVFSSGMIAMLIAFAPGTVQASYTGQTAQDLVPVALAQINDTSTPVISTEDQSTMVMDTAEFARAVQELNIDAGSVSRAIATQNAEHAYAKVLARGLFDTTMVQQAFDTFNSASNVASNSYYAAQSLVLSHTGFDMYGNTLNIDDASATLTAINNDLTSSVGAYQSAFTALQNNLMAAYAAQNHIPQFSIPAAGNGIQRVSLPISSIEVSLINGLGTNKLQDLTAAFIRVQQMENKDAGYVTLANNTMNREHGYLKMLERDGMNFSLVQQAFTTFNQAANAAILACGPAQTVVTARAGFAADNTVTNQSDAQTTVSTALADLSVCHDAMAQAFNPLSAAFLNLGLQIPGLPAFGAPTIN